MTSFVENFEKISDLQKQGMEPIRHFTVFAVDAFEKVVRQNYAFAGDILEFAVAQAKLPVDVVEPKALFDAQVASNKAFAELLSDRANQWPRNPQPRKLRQRRKPPQRRKPDKQFLVGAMQNDRKALTR